METEAISLVAGAIVAVAMPVTIAVIRYGPKRSNNPGTKSDSSAMTKELCEAQRGQFDLKLEAVETHIAGVEKTVKEQREDIKEIRTTTTAILKAVKV